MAHYARVVDGFVVDVLVVNNDILTDANGEEQEQLGAIFLAALYNYEPEQFVQASYNGSIRKNYPGLNYTYDEALDAFIPPMPTEGEWVLDEDTCLWVEVVDETD
jgi:hypothetical protein